MKKILFLLTVIMLIAVPENLWGMTNPSDTISPMKLSKKTPLFCEIWLYGEGCRMNMGYEIGNYGTEYIFYDSFFGTGLNIDLGVYTSRAKYMKDIENKFSQVFKSRLLTFRTRFGLGYRYDHIAYKFDKLNPYGVYCHSLSLDANVSYLCIVAGFSADFLLKVNVKENKTLDYNGFNYNCFNKVACRWYVGVIGSLPFVELEWRVGAFIIPKINPNEYTYYNMETIKLDGVFFEVKAAFRLFTSGFNLK